MKLKEKEAIIFDAKNVIAIYLKECNEELTPYVCKMQSTKNGYKEIEEFVLKLVFYSDHTVGSAIMVKENQLNPNSIND